MGTVVYAETKCDRCHKTGRVAGSLAGKPSGWAEIQFNVGKGEETKDLCPTCFKGLMNIGIPRKPRSDKGTHKEKNPQPSPPKRQGRPRKKQGEDPTTLAAQEARKRREEIEHLPCPDCIEKAKCILTGGVAQDCWTEKNKAKSA